MSSSIKIFIGTSDKEDKIIEQVYLYSLFKNTKAKLDITFLRPKRFRDWNRQGWGTPFTCFRYAVPELCNFEGRAIYTDVDMINFRDIQELWETDMEGKPFASAFDTLCDNTWENPSNPDGWFCDSVMLFDCKKAKDYVDNIRFMADYDGKYKHYWLKHHGNCPNWEQAPFKRLDSRWNAYDGSVTDYKQNTHHHLDRDYLWIPNEKRPHRKIKDIWQLHLTSLSSQPWHPRYTSWGYSTHPRQDLMEIYWDYVKKVKMIEKPNYDIR